MAHSRVSRGTIRELVRHYNPRSAKSTAPRADRERGWTAPVQPSNYLSNPRPDAGAEAVLGMFLAFFRPSTAVIATVETTHATLAVDQAGTITSVCDGLYVMLLLRPPRGPPRLQR
jgi:hypothetical protein